MALFYTAPLVAPARRKTREVRVGDLAIGGRNPVVVQSMTTTPTTDTNATVSQIERLVEAGCPLVRLATPGPADVENLKHIRAEMKRRGIRVPLVADVHFLPELALRACDFVEKIRINPGNYADRKRLEAAEYTDERYLEDIHRLRDAFIPLVRKAKERGVALRIGTNHGSLSDRILNRYGDTPLGMAESALEFVKIAVDEGFRDLVLSMKASNVRVMIQACRLLVARMNELKWDFPLHLGVTEAGDGEDGRIRSAMGIGSLLLDGLGDTIRVSLTEDPEREIPVALSLVQRFSRPFDVPESPSAAEPAWDPFRYARRDSDVISAGDLRVGGSEPVCVRTEVPPADAGRFLTVRSSLEPPVEWVEFTVSPRLFSENIPAALAGTPSVILKLDGQTPADIAAPEAKFQALSLKPSTVWTSPEYMEKLKKFLGGRPVWLRVSSDGELKQAVAVLKAFEGVIPCGLELEEKRLVDLGRQAACALKRAGLSAPIHLCLEAPTGESEEDVILRAAAEIGSLLCDGIGDSVEVASAHPFEVNHRIAFNILQASRLRMTRADFISCPSCGRTLFDLQETTARIRARTGHLKGVKIAVMGCIVNGPGEMADADFGYVGSGPGLVNLYAGKECVRRHVPAGEAEERLIELIAEHGRWTV